MHNDAIHPCYSKKTKGGFTMKQIQKLMLFLLLMCIVSNTFAGCGTTVTEVPDSLIADLVRENEYSDLGECKWYTTHHLDQQAHRDTVDITLGIYAPYAEIISSCSAVYEYDRSSDLWSLIKHDSWSDPDYNFSFNDALVGTWSLENNGSTYDITVTEVYPTQISVEFSINESIYAGLDGYYTWEVSGYGTYDLTGSYFKIPLELPEQCYVSWKDTESGENETVTYLNVWISPELGITYAYISPDIQVW